MNQNNMIPLKLLGNKWNHAYNWLVSDCGTKLIYHTGVVFTNILHVTLLQIIGIYVAQLNSDIKPIWGV